jgi:hypothetical protein
VMSALASGYFCERTNRRNRATMMKKTTEGRKKMVVGSDNATGDKLFARLSGLIKNALNLACHSAPVST